MATSRVGLCLLSLGTVLGLLLPGLSSSSGLPLLGGIDEGRAIFEGKGNCTACHAIGGDGKGRGPDLANIGSRAAERARKFGLQGPDAGLTYLVRSVIHPKADVIEDYNPMPETWLAARLSDEEIRNLILFLQSLGGRPDATAISLPEERLEAKREDYQEETRLFSLGDPQKGRDLFHDRKGRAVCISCHTIDGEGEDTCPDLSLVKGIHRPRYMFESILNPSATIVRGYKQLMIEDIDEETIIGLLSEEDDETLTLVVDQEGNTEVIPKSEIASRTYLEQSSMPGNFGELLTAEEVLHLIAYLLDIDGARGDTTPRNEETAADNISPRAALVFPQLTEDQIRYRMAMEKGDAILGGRIYSRYCVACHGQGGAGDGFNARYLETKPANHTLDRRMSKTEDRLLHGVISRGGMKTGRSPLMPPWAGTLTTREIWDLVAYLRTLHADFEDR